jgi:hypothetical protein
VVDAGAGPGRGLGPGAPRPRDRPGARRLGGRAGPGGRDGRAPAAPRLRGVRRGGAARSRAGSVEHRGHRRRPGGDGGGQPRRGAQRPARRRPRGRAGDPRPGPVVPAGRRRLGDGRVRGAGPVPRSGGLAGHPHVALRARAHEPVRHRDRQVLPQRHPRGDPARGLPGRDRLPPRGRRHGAGDLPGRLRELYADESSTAPMVLVGRDHWTETLPAWPLLAALARGRPMEGRVHLADTLEEAAALVG